jgi:hypothetical protein
MLVWLTDLAKIVAPRGTIVQCQGDYYHQNSEFVYLSDQCSLARLQWDILDLELAIVEQIGAILS